MAVLETVSGALQAVMVNPLNGEKGTDLDRCYVLAAGYGTECGNWICAIPERQRDYLFAKHLF